MTGEEELRLKDLALAWHCSPSAVVQRALAQVGTALQGQNDSHPDRLLIRELIREELVALQVSTPPVTGGVSGGPTDTQPADLPPIRTAPGQYKLTTRQGSRRYQRKIFGKGDSDGITVGRQKRLYLKKQYVMLYVTSHTERDVTVLDSKTGSATPGYRPS